MGHDKRKTLEERYEVDAVTGCWNWTGNCDRTTGYGVYSRHKDEPGPRRCAAHRRVYEEHRGPIPEGLQLDHLCRNTMCVNPEHLEAVTPAVNTQRSTVAVLTHTDVKAIRRDKKAPVEVADNYGVSPQTIREIKRGRTWQNI